MYKFINYTNPFSINEADQVVQPMSQDAQVKPLSGKNVDILLTLSEQDQDELNDLLENNLGLKLFTRPAQLVDKADINKKLGEVNLVFAIANSNDRGAAFPNTTGVDLQKSLVFNVYPKQINIDGIESGAVTVSLKIKPDDAQSSVNIIMTSSGGQAKQEEPLADEVAPTPPQETEEPSTEDIALATGEMVGANPKKYESTMPKAIKNFDQFVGESKKKLISDIDMKTGALKKELGDEELTAADLKKAGAKLAKKDKDKKKKGLQLNPKDAKTHKRIVLAKNLMKASGAISESRQEKIKGAKDQLIKIHEVIEKMIKKTSK